MWSVVYISLWGYVFKIIVITLDIPNNLFIKEMVDRQHIGYKLVDLPDGRRGLATLSLPKTATVFGTDYRATPRGKVFDPSAPQLMRTNEVITVSINPVGSKPGEVVSEGCSIRSHNKLAYKVGQRTKSSLNVEDGKGDGIHFFWDPKTPKLWAQMFV